MFSVESMESELCAVGRGAWHVWNWWTVDRRIHCSLCQTQRWTSTTTGWLLLLLLRAVPALHKIPRQRRAQSPSFARTASAVETVLIKLQIVHLLLFHFLTGVDNVLLEQPVAAQHDVQARPSHCISHHQSYSITMTNFALPSFEMCRRKHSVPYGNSNTVYPVPARSTAMRL